MVSLPLFNLSDSIVSGGTFSARNYREVECATISACMKAPGNLKVYKVYGLFLVHLRVWYSSHRIKRKLLQMLESFGFCLMLFISSLFRINFSPLSCTCMLDLDKK